MTIPRSMTLADHLAIETEEAVSPIQREVSRAAADAERRKAWLIKQRNWHQESCTFYRTQLTAHELKLQAVLDELRELS